MAGIADMEGFLTKMGERFKTWKRRYVTLVGSKVYYYVKREHVEEYKVRGEVDVHAASLVVFNRENKDKNGVHAFSVTPSGGKRTYVFCSASDQERKEWVEALRPHTLKKLAAVRTPSVLRKFHGSTKEGSLTKLGGNKKNWRIRWFVLTEHSLAYYRRKKDPQPAGVINIDGAYVELASSMFLSRSFVIFLTPKDGSRRFVLSAINEEDRMDWYDAIVKATIRGNFKTIGEIPTSDDYNNARPSFSVGADKTSLQSANAYGEIDMSYVTNRVIVVSIPQLGADLDARGLSQMLVRLDQLMAHRWICVNLCAECTFDPRKVGNRLLNFGIRAGGVPCFEDLHPLCLRLQSYFEEDRRNVIVFHSSDGLQRAGLVVSCFLMFIGVWNGSVPDAVRFFGSSRNCIDRALISPSHLRWLQLFSYFLALNSPSLQQNRQQNTFLDRFESPAEVLISEIYVSTGSPKIEGVRISCGDQVYTSIEWDDQGHEWYHDLGDHVLIRLPDIYLQGDFTCEFYAPSLPNQVFSVTLLSAACGPQVSLDCSDFDGIDTSKWAFAVDIVSGGANNDTKDTRQSVASLCTQLADERRGFLKDWSPNNSKVLLFRDRGQLETVTIDVNIGSGLADCQGEMIALGRISSIVKGKRASEAAQSNIQEALCFSVVLKDGQSITFVAPSTLRRDRWVEFFSRRTRDFIGNPMVPFIA